MFINKIYFQCTCTIEKVLYYFKLKYLQNYKNGETKILFIFFFNLIMNLKSIVLQSALQNAMHKMFNNKLLYFRKYFLLNIFILNNFYNKMFNTFNFER